MFAVVLLISGVVGSLVLLNVSLVVVIFALVGTFFSFLYAVVVAPVVAVFFVLIGQREKGQDITQRASKATKALYPWAEELIVFMWVRLGRYLFSGSGNDKQKAARALPWKPTPEQEREKKLRDDAKGMLVMTVLCDAAAAITLIRALR